MLKVPKVGIQVEGGEMQGMLLLRREAMRQRPSREMPERKSSTAITDSDEELEVIDLGVRPIPRYHHTDKGGSYTPFFRWAI